MNILNGIALKLSRDKLKTRPFEKDDIEDKLAANL
jgi:hypothetical protein